MPQEDDFIHKELTYKIIGCAMKVHRELGYGFLEKVYENALMVLLEKEGIIARQQYPISVYFVNKVIGEYFADILVEDKVLIELKAIERTANTHYA